MHKHLKEAIQEQAGIQPYKYTYHVHDGCEIPLVPRWLTSPKVLGKGDVIILPGDPPGFVTHTYRVNGLYLKDEVWHLFLQYLGDRGITVCVGVYPKDKELVSASSQGQSLSGAEGTHQA